MTEILHGMSCISLFKTLILWYHLLSCMLLGRLIVRKGEEHLNKLIKKADSVVGCVLPTTEEIAQIRMIDKVFSLMNHDFPPTS